MYWPELKGVLEAGDLLVYLRHYQKFINEIEIRQIYLAPRSAFSGPEEFVKYCEVLQRRTNLIHAQEINIQDEFDQMSAGNDGDDDDVSK